MSCALVWLIPSSRAPARGIHLDGIGISIRSTDRMYRYKSDHLDTASFDGGLIFPRSSVPSEVAGLEYATHDFRPAEDDSRTDDQIRRIKADAAGPVLIAMPVDAVAGDGWERLHADSEPDFYLDYATRRGTFTPDADSPYWFYRHPYATPGRWVDLPTHSTSTLHPPFVFASHGELHWDNPPTLMGHVVTIARKPEGGGITTVANPKMLVMPDGDYLASIRGAAGTRETSLWRSRDRGLTWTFLADGFRVNRDSLFYHRGGIYLLGMNTQGTGRTRIYQSSDEGRTWSTQIFVGRGGQDAPSHVDVVNGRIWKAASAGRGPGFFSAPVDADLMSEASWTLTAPGTTWGRHVLANGQGFASGNEGTLMTTREGRLVNLGKDAIFRPADGWADGISIIEPDAQDLTQTVHNPDDAGPRLPGTSSKYTARYDPLSKRYWALTSSGSTRIALNLYSASSAGGRIGDFQLEKTVLQGHSTGYHGFNYPFLQIDGDDIIFVLRTAWDHHRGTSDRWHDADLFTFHRIPDFRNMRRLADKEDEH